MHLRRSRPILLLPVFGLLAGCNMVTMHPSGDVAVQQRDLIIASTLLMLLIIVPVMLLIALFAWRYRQSNTAATYDPEWHHSTQLEVAIWSAPLAIIVALGALTWISTHVLDPYRPIARISPTQAVPQGIKPLTVEVVALDWKWLFIYPDLGIATVNELAAPVDTPIAFKITASSVMNSFYIPALAGQIYAMPAMETKLHAVINKPGEYEGFSANYSGEGFSDMHFKFHGMSNADFQRWVQTVKAGGGGALNRADYLRLAMPSERDPVHRYAVVAPDLYEAILNECVDSSKMCMSDMMRIDAHGGLGLPGGRNLVATDYESLRRRDGRRARTYVASICEIPGAADLKSRLAQTRPQTRLLNDR
ncbi:ubiquinol oxidase subunit II [Caulobacter sp. S45]|uniref:ubiquinol oxidase subunit II n=1 Tax=Caulobacter sp. S45 TaxID=1641861 RepID=UPI00131DCFA5|nr:ubiquinol oxidase subunit II [Caulobacter sp. S45]